MTPAPPTVQLDAILHSCAAMHVRRGASVELTGVAHDSRLVKPGDLFVALQGERADGHEFLAAAVSKGASALMVTNARFETACADYPDVTVIGVADTQRALSCAADIFYGHPSEKLRIAGVTGTNGKTTTTFLIDAIAREAGWSSARIGTLGASFDGEPIAQSANTTPLASELQAMLATFVARGAQIVAMEVSSHALHRERVADVRFAVGALTNVTRDHLDYHGTMEAYAAAKRRLFDRSAVAVLNADDPYGVRWADDLRGSGKRVVTYAIESTADVRATRVAVDAERTAFDVDGATVELGLRGRFNIANALCAIACARELGVDDRASFAALQAMPNVPGRMESFRVAGVLALVDYAHTPDALERVLTAARTIGTGRVIAVFGCGGDRDTGKRPAMGAIAARLADIVFVTSDNPRGEDPASIAQAIVDGATHCDHLFVELDRRAAIRRAVAAARSGDTVVVAGKGHEPYQILGERTLAFDDRDEVRAALARRSEAAIQ